MEAGAIGLGMYRGVGVGAPVCGDVMRLQVKITYGIVKDFWVGVLSRFPNIHLDQLVPNKRVKLTVKIIKFEK